MYADEMGRQVEASHFCIHLRHDLHQCVIFDRNAADARLIGIEYIISRGNWSGAGISWGSIRRWQASRARLWRA
jgi:hypothetical protein